MTASKFYSAIVSRRRVHAPTMDEARLDYERANSARFAARVLG